MNRLVRKVGVILIVIIAMLLSSVLGSKVMAYGSAPTLCKRVDHGYNSRTGKANCLKHGSFHVRKYQGKMITKFVDGMPDLGNTEGYLCLQHHKNSSAATGENNEINERIYVEGNQYWVQDGWDTDTYVSIKDVNVGGEKDVYYAGHAKTIAKVAYVMSLATKSNVAPNSNRKKKGVQGALWRLSDDFYKNLYVNGEYDKWFNYYADESKHSGWYAKSDSITKAAKKYADSVENYFIPYDETNITSVKWEESGNNYIIGPFQIKFPKSDSTSIQVKNSEGTVISASILDKNKSTAISKITSGRKFYIKAAKSKISKGGTIAFSCTSKMYIADMYTVTTHKAKQEKIITTEDKYKNVTEKVNIKIPLPALKIVKKDADTGRVVEKAGFKFKVTGPSNYAKTVVTNGKGEASIASLPVGRYTITETSVGNNTEYDLNTTPIVKDIITGGSTEVVVKDRKLVNLKIVKKDKDTGAVVKKAGFTFKVTGPNNFSKTVTTNAQGEVTINSIKQGKYTVTETSVGNNSEYDCNFYPVSVTKNITTGGTIEVPMVNEKLGWLKIVKKDKYTGEAMKGVTFTVTGPNNYSKDVTTDNKGEIIIKPLPKGAYTVTEKSIDGTIGNNWQYEASPSVKATITVKSGENVVTLENEKEFINVSGRVFEDNPTDNKQSARNEKYGEANDKLIKGIKVSLYDKETKKVERTAYTDENGKYMFEKVRISKIRNEKNDKNKGYNIIFEYDGLEWTNVVPYDINSLEGANSSKAKEKDADRAAFDNSFAVIKGKGNADAESRRTGERFNSSNVKQEKDLHYDITTIKDEQGKEIGSQAALKTVISDVTGKKVRQIGDGKGGNLDQNYFKIDADINTAKHYLGEAYKYAESTTKLNNYKATEIPNNNLGLYVRSKPDIAVVKDIENIKLIMNGKTQIYKYAERFRHLKTQNPNANIYDVGVKFGNKLGNIPYTRPIYESDYEYRDADATKELQVFVTYKITLKNQQAKLTSIVNNMVDYYDQEFEFNKIGTTIDQNGDNITGDVSCVNDTSPNATPYFKLNINQPISIEGNAEKDLYIRFKLTRDKVEKIVEYNSSESNQNNLLFINNIVEITSYSTKYAEGNRKGQYYAGVDSDSNPGNAVPGDVKTYEDDTDKCPSLKLEKQPIRKMTGTVFNDNTENKDGTREGDGIYNPNEETIPNVIVTYKEEQTGNVYKTKTMEEDGPTNVTYRIRKATGGDKATYNIAETDNIDKIYIIEKEDSSRNSEYMYDPITINNMKKGDYCIGHYIPGNYKLTFTWGDKDHTVQDWKSTIYSQARGTNWSEYSDWYKKDVNTRYSDALDNYTTRQKIDEETIRITHNESTKAEIAKEYEGPSGRYIIKMDSTTPGMDVGIEVKEVSGNKSEENIENIDFGIVERPKQTLTITKRVKKIKATLANGQTIVNADIVDGKLTGEYRHTTYMKPTPGTPGANGTVKLEMDNELIQGCTIEVEYELIVQNTSEIDYAYQEYYNYGTKASMTNAQKAQYAVKLEPTTIIDYLDNDWMCDEQENGNIWKYIDDNIKEEYLDKGIYEKEEGTTQELEYNKVKKLYTRYFENKKLVPAIFTNPNDYTNTNTANSSSVSLKVSKVLSTTDEIDLDNQAEIVEVKKTGEKPEDGGGSLLTTIPGNYIPKSDSHENDDATAENTVVTPSTGEDRSYIVPIGIGVAALVTLGIGVLIIKKKTIAE